MAADPSSRGRSVVLDEPVIAQVPFVIRRRVKWGEIDFARVAYTGKFLDWVLEAAEAWFWQITGEHWSEFDLRNQLSLPAVGCTLDFHVALHPYEELDLTVRLARVGRSSHTVAVEGHNQKGVLCFEGTLTFAAIDPATERSVAMPDDLRARLEDYRRACEAE